MKAAQISALGVNHVVVVDETNSSTEIAQQFRQYEKECLKKIGGSPKITILNNEVSALLKSIQRVIEDTEGSGTL